MKAVDDNVRDAIQIKVARRKDFAVGLDSEVENAAHSPHVEIQPAIRAKIGVKPAFPRKSGQRGIAPAVDGFACFMMLAVAEPFVLGARDPVAYTWQGEG